MRVPPLAQIATVILLAPLGCGGKPATAPSSTAPPVQSVDPLRDAARAAGKLVGTAVQSTFLNDARYASVFTRHFDYVTAEYEMKWDPIERTRGVEDFSGGDMIA